jgi:SAM-dependent methyltransferase
LYNELRFLDDERANGQYELVQNYLPKKGHIDALELGAGSALLSMLLRHKRGNVDIEVVEPGLGWNKYYRDNGIKKVADFFPFETKKKYTYIHASHWLEHVTPDIQYNIDAVRQLLMPNGTFFVEVPNRTDDYWNLDVGDTPHIHFFTEPSLRQFFENCGLRLLTIGCYGYTNREFHKFIHPSTKVLEPNEELLKEVSKSLRYSIPRKGGDSIRAVFQKPS